MFYIIKKINYDKIHIKYVNNKHIHKLYYKLSNNIDIIGIPLSIKYNSLSLHYNLVYVYLNDINILQPINQIIYNKTGINIIKRDTETNKRYIVCKNTNGVKIDHDNININISKIITNSNNCVPLIYII